MNKYQKKLTLLPEHILGRRWANETELVDASAILPSYSTDHLNQRRSVHDVSSPRPVQIQRAYFPNQPRDRWTTRA